MQRRRVGRSQIVAVVAVFAALNVVSDSLMGLPGFSAGVWFSWNFLMEPLTGIVIGPLLGFAASFIGVMIGHYVYFIDAYEFLFTLGAPIGAAVSALVFMGKWKPVLLYYAALFTAYFLTPVAWQLPLWGMWDTYLAFAVLLAAALLIKRGVWERASRRLPFVLAVAAFVGLEADVLFRIFILVPSQGYRLFYVWDVDFLRSVWTAGAVITPLKVALSTVATVVVGHPLVKALRKGGFLGQS